MDTRATPSAPVAQVVPDLRHRPDLDGLRALAVVAVLLFHAELPFATGGYVGVDVFFVVSGYLITQRVVAAREAGRFRFGSFYRRRVRRLLPASLTTIAATLVAGVVLLPPSRLAELGIDAAAAATSWSNIRFALTTGYWDTEALGRPLLHTWSLGVEEQFYLVWPALLLLALRSRRALRWLLVLGAVALVASVAITPRAPEAAFYLMPLRTHEFVAGAACVWLDRHAWPDRAWVPAARQLLVAGGVAAILWCTWAFGEATAFPGLPVLVPVAATVAVLLARAPGGPVSGLLTNRPAQLVGRTSYSLYLVHWPVLVLAAEVTGGLDAATLVWCLGLTVALTWLQYVHVEQRFRVTGSTAGTVAVRPVLLGVAGTVAASLALVVVAPSLVRADFGTVETPVAGDAPDGADGATPDPLDVLTRTLEAVNADRLAERERVCGIADDGVLCGAVDPAGTNVLVLGDSQGVDGLNVVAAAAPGANALFSGIPGCPPLLDLTGVDHQATGCAASNDALLAAVEPLADDLDVVLLSLRLREDRLATLADTVAWFVDRGVQVAVLGAGHEFEGQATELLLERGVAAVDEPAEEDWLRPGRAEDDASARAVVEAAGGIYVPRLELFCPDGVCAMFTPDRTELVIHDFTHLTPGATELLADELERVAPRLSTALGAD